MTVIHATVSPAEIRPAARLLNYLIREMRRKCALRTRQLPATSTEELNHAETVRRKLTKLAVAVAESANKTAAVKRCPTHRPIGNVGRLLPPRRRRTSSDRTRIASTRRTSNRARFAAVIKPVLGGRPTRPPTNLLISIGGFRKSRLCDLCSGNVTANYALGNQRAALRRRVGDLLRVEIAVNGNRVRARILRRRTPVG